MGPVNLAVIPPIRRWVGDESPKRVPLTYPGEYLRTVFGRTREGGAGGGK